MFVCFGESDSVLLKGKIKRMSVFILFYFFLFLHQKNNLGNSNLLPDSNKAFFGVAVDNSYPLARPGWFYVCVLEEKRESLLLSQPRETGGKRLFCFMFGEQSGNWVQCIDDDL